MATYTLTCRTDGLLATIAPLGLAAAAGTALVVDLDPAGPRYPGDASLADLVRSGPRAADLTPQRSGVAVLANGGISRSEAEELLAALVAGWPTVVFAGVSEPHPSGPLVPVIPLLPGAMAPHDSPSRAVFQRTGYGESSPAGGIVLPRPSRNTVLSLLKGRLPIRSRWVRSWARVLEVRWT